MQGVVYHLYIHLYNFNFIVATHSEIFVVHWYENNFDLQSIKRLQRLVYKKTLNIKIERDRFFLFL